MRTISVIILITVLSSLLFANVSFVLAQGTASKLFGSKAICNVDAFFNSKAQQELNKKIQDLQKDVANKIAGVMSSFTTVPVFDRTLMEQIIKELSAIQSLQKTAQSLDTKNACERKMDVVMEFIHRFLLEFLKRRILDTLVRQTIQWVQGGGTPQFIQNWKGFLSDAANKALGNTLYSIKATSFLCSPMNFRIVQNMFSRPPEEAPVYCTFTQIVGNLESFVQNFENGSWFGWNTAWEPENNYIGNYFIAWESSMQAVIKSTKSAQSEGQSGGGYLNITECTATDAEKEANGGKCPENKKKATTPGGLIGSQVTKAVGTNIDYILNANDLSQYATALIDAVLNRLIREGLAKMSTLGASSEETSAINEGISSNTYIAPAGSSISTMCDGLSGEEYNSCIAGATGSFTQSGFTPAYEGVDPVRVTESVQTRLDELKTHVSALLLKKTQYFTVLQSLYSCQVTSSVPYIAANASSTRQKLNNASSSIAQLTEIQNRATELQNDLHTIASSTEPIDSTSTTDAIAQAREAIDELITQFNALDDSATINAAITQAQQDLNTCLTTIYTPPATGGCLSGQIECSDGTCVWPPPPPGCYY